MTTVRPNELAELEIAAELHWYSAESEHLAERLWQDIQHAMQVISEYPAAGEEVPRVRVDGEVRRFPLRDFPYFVIYREHPDYLEIVALAHTSRNPNYWRSRVT